MTRRLKRKYDEINHVAQVLLGLPLCICPQPHQRGQCLQRRCLQDVHDLAPIDQQLEQEHQERTKVKNIQVWPQSAVQATLPTPTEPRMLMLCLCTAVCGAGQI